MKIAAIINPYWDTLGGGERYTAALIKLLLDNQWQVDVRWLGDLPQKIYQRFGIDISQAHFLPELVDLKNYDLEFWVSDGSLPLPRARRTLVHFQFPFKNIGGRSFKNLIKSRRSTFIVNSNFTKKFIDREFLIKSRVVYPPVSVDSFSPGHKENIILYVGRFSRLLQNKHHDILINSFRRLSANFPDWRLILAGGTGVGASDDGVGELKQLSRGLPVDFIFDPDFPTLRSLYARAKIFWSASGYAVSADLNPTLVEHFGISLVESMAAGCVPLAVALGGHREIVDTSVNGFLWSSTQELEDFTGRVLRDEKLRQTLSKAAREKSKIFSTAEFNNRFSQIIHL